MTAEKPPQEKLLKPSERRHRGLLVFGVHVELLRTSSFRFRTSPPTQPSFKQKRGRVKVDFVKSSVVEEEEEDFFSEADRNKVKKQRQKERRDRRRSRNKLVRRGNRKGGKETRSLAAAAAAAAAPFGYCA